MTTTPTPTQRQRPGRTIYTPEAVLARIYRRYWTLPETASPTTFRNVYRDIIAQERRVGPTAAAHALRTAAHTYHREHGICPFCRQHGPLHVIASQEQETHRADQV